MKAKRLITTIVLFSLIIVGVLSIYFGKASSEIQRVKSVAEGDELMSKKLYQRAMEAYSDALVVDESKTVRDKYILATREAFDEGLVSDKQVIALLEESCTLYPKEVPYWEQLTKFYMGTGRFESAKSTYEKALKNGAKSDKLDGYDFTLKYLFKNSNKLYSFHQYSPYGRWTVHTNKGWGVIGTSGNVFWEIAYNYASPIDKGKNTFLITEDRGILIDADGVIKWFVPDEITEARAVYNSILPAKFVIEDEAADKDDDESEDIEDTESEDIEDTESIEIEEKSEDEDVEEVEEIIEEEDAYWQYYDLEAEEYIFDEYDNASSFVDGIAAVKSGSSWKLINDKGEDISDASFVDIKLFESGEYCYDGVMVAAEVEGEYNLYNADGSLLVEVKAADMDNYYGSRIAYKDASGKWGFINKEGEVRLEPEYDNARSYSGGLAAVCHKDKWGFLNKENQLAIDYQFVDATYFNSNGVALVSSEKGWYYFITLLFVE